jgi:hypothetical protein
MAALEGSAEQGAQAESESTVEVPLKTMVLGGRAETVDPVGLVALADPAEMPEMAETAVRPAMEAAVAMAARL